MVGHLGNVGLYGYGFYAARNNRTEYSARATLKYLKSISDFESVIDVGCGTGTWLKCAKELGAESIKGLEGSWLAQDHLQIEKNNLELIDLEQPLQRDLQADLTISLEVAEHLPHERAPSFISDLCALSPMVLFSAAIPKQGGTGHINEQPQSYWISLFEDNNFFAYDIIRPFLWGNPQVPFWYQQNAFLFIQAGKENSAVLKEAQKNFVANLTHPDVYNRPPGIRTRLKYMYEIPTILAKRLRRKK